MQESPDTVDYLAEILSQLGWIDRSALLILLVFFVLGIFRGFVWQMSRIGILVLSYAAAVLLGRPLARIAASWFSADVHPDLPLYVSWFMLFVAVLVSVALLARLIQSLVEHAGFGWANRLGGGVLGFATGGLVVMALLTAVFMVNDSLGAGDSIVRAAEQSRSRTISYEVLRLASRVLPEDWRDGPDGWRALLHDPELETEEPADEPPGDRLQPFDPARGEDGRGDGKDGDGTGGDGKGGDGTSGDGEAGDGKAETGRGGDRRSDRGK